MSGLGYWFVFQDDHLLVHKDTSKARLLNSPLVHLQFIREFELGMFNNIICYSAEISTDVPIPEELVPVSLRHAFEILGFDWYVVMAKAISVINWDKNHQFCGRCGHQTSLRQGSFERICTHCGLSFFPRISPSIIVLIKKGDQILMSRSPHFTKGAYGLIAGFIEVGESIEHAVHREVKEEVNLEITNLQYFGSQSWPFPDSLMIAFTADYLSGEITIDTTELESAAWYPYNQLPGGPSHSMSIARKLINHFVAEQDKLHRQE